MVKTIYIARHAFRANWVADYDASTSFPTGIPGDIALAQPYGHEQSAQLADYLKTIKPAIQRIYSSPFVRCVETCKPFVEESKLPMFIENGISEWYRPDRKGGIPIPASKETLSDIFPNDLINVEYNPTLFPNPKGETFNELKARVGNFFTQFIRNLNESQPEIETILITTHAATKIILARHLIGDETANIKCGTCSVDKYTIKPEVEGVNPGDWDCQIQGYTEFLANGEEMNWSFENLYEVGTEKDLDARRRASGGKLLSERRNSNLSITVPLDMSALVKENGVHAEDEDEDEEAIEEDDEDAEDDDEELVSVYVPLDLSRSTFKGNRTSSNHITISSQTILQIVDLHSEKPLFRVGNRIYQGSWSQLTGTELYSDEEGQIFAKTRTRIMLTPGEMVSKEKLLASENEDSKKKRNKSLLERMNEIKLRKAQQTKENGASEDADGDVPMTDYA